MFSYNVDIINKSNIFLLGSIVIFFMTVMSAINNEQTDIPGLPRIFILKSSETSNKKTGYASTGAFHCFID